MKTIDYLILITSLKMLIKARVVKHLFKVSLKVASEMMDQKPRSHLSPEVYLKAHLFPIPLNLPLSTSFYFPIQALT